jgi:hypothetical protein
MMQDKDTSLLKFLEEMQAKK